MMRIVERFIKDNPEVHDYRELVNYARIGIYTKPIITPFTSHAEELMIRCAEVLRHALEDEQVDEELLRIAEEAFPLHCPEKGSFTTYKKVMKTTSPYCPGVATLIIPEHALRSSAFGNKCRASEVFVKRIESLSGKHDYVEAESYGAFPFGFPSAYYKIGETTFPDSFDKNRWVECGHGIHFFMTKQEAIDY